MTGKQHKTARAERQLQTFRISLAALEVLSETITETLASIDKILALIQRCTKAFHDCSERSATKMFLES